jgi:uncharacterized protein (UPF0332 family)
MNTTDLLDYATAAIEAGRRELGTGDAELAADRGCVAMLRVATAALVGEGLAPAAPEGIAVAYGQRFARTGRLYSAYHRWLLDAMDLRKAAAGDLPALVDVDSAAMLLDRAEIFHDAVARFIAQPQPDRGAS